jgi:hypothetical protein
MGCALTSLTSEESPFNEAAGGRRMSKNFELPVATVERL